MLNVRQNLLMTRLMWPTPPEDRKEKLHFKRTLQKARRELERFAPLELTNIGYRLLPQRHEGELIGTLNKVLQEIDTTSEEHLVTLIAPELDSRSQRHYKKAYTDAMLELVGLLVSTKTKIGNGMYHARLFNQVFFLYEAIADVYCFKEEQRLYGKVLRKLSQEDIEGSSQTVGRIIDTLAKRIGENL